jgi:hypothetical protein
MSEPDDWSFILKLHAILESALTCVLEKRLRADDFDERLSFAGKVQLVFRLPECVRDPEYRTFFVALNSLRNRFAHSARYIFADFSTVFQDIPPPKRRSLLESLAVAVMTRQANPHPLQLKSVRERWTREFPRITIFGSASYALELLSLAYYIQLGVDGNYYAEEFRPQLQDLLNDSNVIKFQRDFLNWFREQGLTAEENE